MFLRLSCRGLVIEHNVNGWRMETDAINIASGNSGWMIDPISGRWSGERAIRYTLVCERGARALLMDQLALAQQLVNAINISANAWGLNDQAELRADRAGTTVFAMPTSAQMEILSIAQSSGGWTGRVALTLTTPDPWLLAEPPTTGGATNDSNRIVRNNITMWAPMDISFTPNDHAPSPASWTVTWPSDDDFPILWLLGRIDPVAQRTAITLWRPTFVLSGTITSGAHMNRADIVVSISTAQIKYDLVPFFANYQHFSSVYDVWIVGLIPVSSGLIIFNSGSASLAVLRPIITMKSISPPQSHGVHYLGRFSLPNVTAFSITLNLVSTSSFLGAWFLGLALVNPSDASAMGVRDYVHGLSPNTMAWSHRATRLWREHRCATRDGALSDVQMHISGIQNGYIGASDPLAHPRSIAIVGSSSSLTATANHVLCRRGIAHVSE